MLSHQDGLVDAAVIVDYVVEFIQFFKHSCVCVCVVCYGLDCCYEMYKDPDFDGK